MPRALVGDVELEYATLGGGQAGERPAIVLIRGLGTQLIEWSEQLLHGLVELGLTVVVFDNRDVGLSTKCVEDYTLSDMAGDVIGLLDHLNIPQAHIFGISLGGMVAQLIAVEHAHRCITMSSVMSGSGNPEVPTVSREMLPLLVEKASGREALIALNARNRQLFGSPDYPESADRRLQDATAAYDRCYYPEGVARQMSAANADGSRVARLGSITVPSLVLHGIDDPLVDIAAGEDTARHIPAAKFVSVPGMGHNIPDALAPVLVRHFHDFLTELE